MIIKGRSGRQRSVRTENHMWLWENVWDCETMSVSKEIHKTFVPGDRSFKEFSYAHAHNAQVRNSGGAGEKIFRPPWKNTLDITTIGHSLKYLGQSQKILRTPWCPMLLTGLIMHQGLALLIVVPAAVVLMRHQCSDNHDRNEEMWIQVACFAFGRNSFQMLKKSFVSKLQSFQIFFVILTFLVLMGWKLSCPKWANQILFRQWAPFCYSLLGTVLLGQACPTDPYLIHEIGAQLCLNKLLK